MSRVKAIDRQLAHDDPIMHGSGKTSQLPHWLLALVMAASSHAVLAQAMAAPSRGQLLYDTHCVTCHDTQVHWRQSRKVSNWKTLVAQVRHWQSAEKLQWTEDDIRQVARHLNDTIYRYPLTSLAQRE